MKKKNRQIRALKYLEQQLAKGGDGLLNSAKKRIEGEISILKDRLSGIRKKGKLRKTEVATVDTKWVIDIFSVRFGYTKNSVRRKNKGRSRKKMKRVKNLTFVKSISAQSGTLIAYKEGRMGLSPKEHVFKLRQE